MRGMTPKSVLSRGLWAVMLSFAFAMACTGATDDTVTPAGAENGVATAAPVAAPSTATIDSTTIETTVAAAVEATATAVADAGIEAVNMELESIIQATVETYTDTSTYVPAPGYWRIREGAGQIFFESSTNGTAWNFEMQTAVPFDITRIRVGFGVETSGPMGAGVGIQFPGYNTI